MARSIEFVTMNVSKANSPCQNYVNMLRSAEILLTVIRRSTKSGKQTLQLLSVKRKLFSFKLEKVPWWKRKGLFRETGENFINRRGFGEWEMSNCG